MICGAAAEGDTEDMNRERAETYLRVLAEAELRRATSQPWSNAPRAAYAARVKRVAQVLAFVGALDEGAADQILDDFELALGAPLAGQVGHRAGRRADARAGPARADSPGLRSRCPRRGLPAVVRARGVRARHPA